MAEVLTLPGIKGPFAVGLLWRHEDDAPKGKALRQLAGKFGQWGTVFTAHGRGVQVGFCEPLPHIKSPASLKALAATIANQYPQPWRGVFKLDENRYWYIAVRDGQEILPDGDRIGTSEEIKAILEDHDGHGNWTNYDKTIQDLADIVRSHSRFHKLRDLGFDPTLRYTGIAAGVAALWIAAGTGLFLHSKHQQEALAARLAAVRARGAADHAAGEMRANERIWADLPIANEVLAVCRKQWGMQQLARHGWIMASWSCSADSSGVIIETEWSRNGGLASDAPGQLKPDGNNSTDSQTVPVAWQIHTDAAESGAQSARDIWTLAQTYGLSLKLEQNPAAATIVDSDGKPIRRPWSQAGATLSLAAPPWLIPGSVAFDKVPGLRLTRISLDTKTLNWNVIGSLYSMHQPRAGSVETDPAKNTHAVSRARQRLAEPVAAPSLVKQLPAAGGGSYPTIPPRPGVAVRVRPPPASETVRPAPVMGAGGDTPAEADGSTIVVPVSNSSCPATSTAPASASASIGMGALALAQQARRARNFQLGTPAAPLRAGAQALTPPGLGE